MSRPARPKKGLGQHFLTDPRILGRIADALSIEPGDTVIEIGSGRGALTAQLATRVGPTGRLFTIEIDRALAAALRETYGSSRNTTVVEGDVLKLNFMEFARGPYLLIGNVPYQITTPILFHALARPRAERMAFLVQREVAERVIAKPGGKEYGALSVNVQAVARAEIALKVSAGSFTPPPKVESSLLRITPRPDPLVAADDEPGFRAMVQGVFSFRRKTMLRVVRELWSLGAEDADVIVEAADIDPIVRPETLSPEAFARLWRARPAGKA